MSTEKPIDLEVVEIIAKKTVGAFLTFTMQDGSARCRMKLSDKTEGFRECDLMAAACYQLLMEHKERSELINELLDKFMAKHATAKEKK